MSRDYELCTCLWCQQSTPLETVVGSCCWEEWKSNESALRARIAELEADRESAWRHYAACAGTPLMSDVMREREAAHAKVRELEDELKTWTDNGFQHDWAEENAALRAENARLREALERYAYFCACCGGTKRVINLAEEEVDCWLCRDARAALGVKP